jgi:hypothetical protein
MSTWFIIRTYGPIEEIEAERATEHFLIVKGRREPRESDWHHYAKTREAAKAWMVAKRQSDVVKAKRILEDAEHALTNAEAL